jgi:hypothetical protein
MARFEMYTAKLKNGQRVVSVFATNTAEAREEVMKELHLNPSRRAYKNKWVHDGKLVALDRRDI